MIWKYIFTMFSVTLAQTNNGKGNAYAYGKSMSGSSGSSGMLADFLSSLTTTLSTLSSTTLSTLSSTTLSTLSSTTLSTLSSTTLSTLSSTTLSTLSSTTSSIGNNLSVFDESKSDQNDTGRETTFPLSYVLGATTLLAISSILTFLLIKHKKKEPRIEELYVYHDNNTDPLEYTYQSNSNYLQPQISEENFQNNYYSEAGNECVELYCLASSSDSETYDNSSFYDIGRE